MKRYYPFKLIVNSLIWAQLRAGFMCSEESCSQPSLPSTCFIVKLVVSSVIWAQLRAGFIYCKELWSQPFLHSTCFIVIKFIVNSVIWAQLRAGFICCKELCSQPSLHSTCFIANSVYLSVVKGRLYVYIVKGYVVNQTHCSVTWAQLRAGFAYTVGYLSSQSSPHFTCFIVKLIVNSVLSERS